MFRKIVIIFILTLVFCFDFKAFSRNFEILPEWKPSFETDGVRFLLFTGAVYDNRFPGIPFYHINFETSRLMEVVSCRIVNARYESLSREDLIVANQLDKKNTDFSFQCWSSENRGIPMVSVSFIPLHYNESGIAEKLVSGILEVELKVRKVKKAMTTFAQQSVLANGYWYKIKIDKTGLYSLTFDELKSMGFSQPENIRVYGNGGIQLSSANSDFHPDDLIENPIMMEKGSDGIFNSGDYIVFYAVGSVKWRYDNNRQMFLHSKHAYSDDTYYFLTTGYGPGKRMENAVQISSAATVEVTAYDDFVFHDNDAQNLLKTGRTWFGESFAPGTEHNFTFRLEGRVPGEPIEIYTHVAARSPQNYPNSYFTLLEKNNPIQQISVSGINFSVYYLFAYDANNKATLITSDDNVQLALRYNSGYISAKGWLDYICINTSKKLEYQPGQFMFRDISTVDSGAVAGYKISNVPASCSVIDITDPYNPLIIQAAISGGILTFKATADSLREFVCFDKSEFYKPDLKGEGTGSVENQDLHASGVYDYVIVAPPAYITYAEQLADFHRTKSGLRTMVVKPEQIYNEFSSGKPDPMAIRLLMKMLYDRAASDSDKPRYLLLFGDGTYDNKGIISSNANLLPTYQSEASLSETSSFVSDDFYAMLDDTEYAVTGFEDIGVGRFPVNNASEAALMVNKILSYCSSQTFGDWRNVVCFLADDADNNETEHMVYTDLLANKVASVAPDINIEKIYLDQFPQVSTSSGERYPAVTQALISRVNRGTVMLNYTGHGNPEQITHEAVLTVKDIFSFTNINKLTLFVTASCEVSRFDDFSRVSLGEHFLLHGNGGAVALFSTTRLVYSGSNFNLNDNFCGLVVSRDLNGQALRLGDVVRLAKINSGGAGNMNKRNFCLLGDPALKIGIPELNIVPESINGQLIQSGCDTLKALSKITVSGYITDVYGNRTNDFNGRIYPTIYDKSFNRKTLSNDGSSPLTYQVQNSILYKGLATVTNGNFSFSFIVPKDIQYNYGNGKISCYAENGITDAKGSNFDLVIGGFSGTELDDQEGPEIKLYMNDEKFVNGGTTDQSPVLLAVLSDSSGINTTGNAIGHDITAIIDNNRQQVLVLNDYYQAGQDNYQQGKVMYKLPEMETGEHRVNFKVWDINNISSEKSLDFVVTEASEPLIRHLLNYPNPFTTHTEFYFEHNMANQDLEVVLEIFTVTGRIIKTFSQVIPASGFRCGPIPWDGFDEYGDRLGRGVYVYRLKIKSTTGHSVEKYEKLVILK